MTLAAPATKPPRQYFGSSSVAPVLPGFGLPHDRHARIAARRSFVDLKQQFMAACDTLDGMRGDWLRHQVRQAQEPVDLWLLRGAVFGALETQDEFSRRTRADLNRMLDSVFPDSGQMLAFGMRL